MKRKLIETADKTKTLLIPEWNETYHSTNGAGTEAIHVFIKNGLESLNLEEVHIFEMGFGTGLNALLSLEYSRQTQNHLRYDSIEKYPLSFEEAMTLNYPQELQLDSLQEEFELLHSSEWNKVVPITSAFSLNKIEGDFKQLDLTKELYDVIFYDAFGPRYQAELWSEEVCKKLYDSLKPNAFLVTYCAQGQFKRNLKSVGFRIESLAGPPGKREMTRAYKN